MNPEQHTPDPARDDADKPVQTQTPVVESVAADPTPVHHQGALPAVTDPGRTMGIVAMVLSIVGVHLVGLVLGIVALIKSKKAGHKNGFALAAIIIGAVMSVLVAIGFLFFILVGSHAVSEYDRQCKTGDTYTLYGETVACEDL